MKKRAQRKADAEQRRLFLFLGCIRKDFLSVDQSSDDSLEMAIVYAGSILTVYNLRPYARGDLPGSLSAAARRNFNSRPCTRGDAAPAAPAPPASYFNSRPCTRGDRDGSGIVTLRGLFQFTPLHEGRHPWRRTRPARRHFNSRPCTRGDPITVLMTAASTLFQFTPLHEGRP